MRWTKEQELILYTYGHRGAEYCRNLIFKLYRVRRSVEATERHANRIHASMTKYSVCPVCGRIERKLNRHTGMCTVCNYDHLWREQIEKEVQIKKDLQKGGENVEGIKAKQRYRAQQRKNERLSKYGNIVDLSESLSAPSSEPQKNFPPRLFDPGNDGEKEMWALA